jgi:cytochrome b
MSQRSLVWDVPTRVFHWSLALSFAGAYITSETERYRDVHVALGYVFFGLILFRLIWGFVGSHYARFSSFSFKPSETIAYVKSLLAKQPAHYVGHNPAGSVAIYLLLALGVMIGVSGILLYWEVGGEEAFEEIHEIAANGMLAVVLVHIAGVFASSLLHKENLVRAMLTGYKQTETPTPAVRAYAVLGLLLLAAVVGFLIFYLR